MADAQAGEQPKLTIEQEHAFLVADFEHVAESFLQNEAEGEKRVTLFIGLVTAALGAVGFVATELPGVNFKAVLAVVLIALLALGVLTLFRLRRRNDVRDVYKETLKRMRLVGAPSLSAGYRDGFGTEPKRLIVGGHLATMCMIVLGLGAVLVWALVTLES